MIDEEFKFKQVKIEAEIKSWGEFKNIVYTTLQQGFSAQQLINYIELIEREKTFNR